MPSDQFQCFSKIVTHESGWNPSATNSSSGAYGLVQALPGSKMASAGADWKSNPATQIKWGLNYMNDRYGSPCGAWNFWQQNSWY
ncbi:lytic transglycosylase domain-containing protein, partial [Streptomyces sp. SID1034]